MPSVNLRKKAYITIVRHGDEPKDIVNEATEEWIEEHYEDGD